MFINPMWSCESQRIGMQRCTPKGYMLHGISDLIGLIAIFLLLGVPIYLAYSAICGQFAAKMLWLFLIPFIVAIAGNLFHSYSWHLADKQQFKYEYEKSLATWVDVSGIEQSYQFRVTDDDSV